MLKTYVPGSSAYFRANQNRPNRPEPPGSRPEAAPEPRGTARRELGGRGWGEGWEGMGAGG